MNRIRSGALVLLAALAAPCAHAQDALATIKTSEYALGMIRGPQRIDAINTMEVWGTGTSNNAKITYHASYSYRTPAMRVDITRSDPAPQRQIQTVNGMYAWNESVPGAGFIPGSVATPIPADLDNRLLQMWTTPHGVLKAAERAANDAKVVRDGTFVGKGGTGVTIVTFPLDLPKPGPLAHVTVKVTLNIKNQVEKVETTGAAAMEITYSDYKDLGEIPTDVLFPSHITQKQGGRVVFDLTVTKTDPNNPYVVFPIPDVVEKAGQPTSAK